MQVDAGNAKPKFTSVSSNSDTCSCPQLAPCAEATTTNKWTCECVTLWRAQMKQWSLRTCLWAVSQFQQQQRESCVQDEPSMSAVLRSCRVWKHIRHADPQQTPSSRWTPCQKKLEYELLISTAFKQPFETKAEQDKTITEDLSPHQDDFFCL